MILIVVTKKNLITELQWGIENNGNFNTEINIDGIVNDNSLASLGNDIGLNNFRDDDGLKKEVIVALIDGGASNNVNYYDEKIWNNRYEKNNGIDDDKNGYIDDVFGWNFRNDDNKVYDDNNNKHGTSLMFLLNGRAYGYKSLLSDCNCSIMNIRILSDLNGAKMSDLIKAIKYAEDNGASVCNLSVATFVDDQRLYDVMSNSEMLFLVAAGNDGMKISKKKEVFPAMYNMGNMITVGAMRTDGRISNISNYSEEYVDVVAPGVNVLSKNDDGNWEFFSGTTYATAFATAVATKEVLMYNNKFDALKIKKQLMKNVKKRRHLKKYVKSGGIINIQLDNDFLKSNK